MIEYYLAVQEKFKNDPQRFIHILGVRNAALVLGKIYNLDLEKLEIAAIFHDYTKNDSFEAQKSYLDINIIDKYQSVSSCVHGFSAAGVMEKEFGITDDIILDAVKYHVFGRKKMTDYDKIIFISDVCEIGRSLEHTELIFSLAKKSLNEALIKALEIKIDYAQKRGRRLHFEQIDVFNYYKKANK